MFGGVSADAAGRNPSALPVRDAGTDEVFPSRRFSSEGFLTVIYRKPR